HGPNSRLYRTLVVDKGVAVSAGASYDGTAVDNTRLSVFGTPKPETSLPQLEEAIDAVLADLIDNGVTAEELERAKSRMIANAVYANDNQRMLAQWYGASLATGATVEDVRAWPTASGSSPPTPCATPPGAGSTSAARSPAISSRTRGTRRNARER